MTIEVQGNVISVIIPSYNHIDYVGDAISSVLGQIQDGYVLELIVVDDGSTDGSVALLKELHRAHDYKFKLVFKNNEGLCRTLNRAIGEFATGDYIAIIASDDMWHPEKLSKQLKLLRGSPRCSLCYSGAQTFGEHSNGGRASRFLFSGNIRNLLTLYNFIPAGTIFFTRKLYDSIGGFDETGLRLEDWDFLLRASAVTSFCYLNKELLLYRLHDESSIAKMRERGILFAEKMKVLRKNKSILNPSLRYCSICLHFALDVVLRPFISRLKAK
ncbi:glycosyltransferase family 2 protein [Pseudomonas sp. EA_105y_Pfl2_R69]|uniref:glycosyltransferase family 2 protein n=1 Tax=Pseudomonas sp. EA_105y_Pfl2_R69 TaxID=3088683 RepID=UPI0030D89697